MTNRRALVIFTETYPFDAGAEAMFLLPELTALQEMFGQITVVPQHARGSRLEVPAGIAVDLSLATGRFPLDRRRKVKYALGAATSHAIVLRAFTGAPTARRMRAVRSAMRRSIDVQHARDWVRGFIKDRQIDVATTVFYTYWLTSVTEGLVLAGKRSSSGPRLVVSRAHGSDLYEDRSVLGAVPGRSRTIRGLTALFLISEYGQRYVTSLYPTYTNYVVCRLGVPDPGGISRPSDDGVCRVVSCSFVRALKRIDLLFDALLDLAARIPEKTIEWTHIGAGELWEALQHRVTSEAPGNLTCRLVGTLENDQVTALYLSEPFDAFINVSSSEGVPVSIMEAQSCGIPVIATGVGGSPEVVSSRVGILLPSNPTPAAISSAILELTADRAAASDRRKASRENWYENYNASRNYKQFAHALLSLSSS